MLLPGAILATVVGIGLLASFAASFADGPTIAAARDAIVRIADGDPLGLTRREAGGLGTVAAVVLLQPLGVIGLMLLIELASGPRKREPKQYLLVWSVQAVFLTVATLVGFAGAKIGILPSQPLWRVEAPGGTAELLLRTLPLYLLALFVADFFRYWFHRAQHRFPLLWRFHSVHHGARDLDALHNITHPVEQLGNLFIVSVPTVFLIGVDAGQLYVLSAFLSVHTYVIHMNVPLHFGRFRNVICDNRYHFLHHSRRREDFDTNFAGLFPVLDRMFGTYRAPVPGPLPETGLEEGCPSRFSHFVLARWPRDPSPD